MARSKYWDMKCHAPKVVEVFGYATVSGEALGVDTVPHVGLGLTSIDYTATGTFRCNLDRKYFDLLDAHCTVNNYGEGEVLTDYFTTCVLAEDVTGTDGVNDGNGTVTFGVTVSGSLAEPNRSIIYFDMKLGASQYSAG